MAHLLFLIAMCASTPAIAQVISAEPFAGAAVTDDTLAATTGRADLNQASWAELRATVSGNSINGPSATGTIVIDGQAFQNLNGLSVLNANTGNNVAINSSMQVNVAINP